MDERVLGLLKKEHIDQAAGFWGQPEQVTLLDTVENFVYDFVYKKKRHILRITHCSHREEDDIIAELDWVEFLHSNGVRVCRPVTSKKNTLTEVIEIGDSYFVACVFQRAPGEPCKGDHAVCNSELCSHWGSTIGKIHALSKIYNPMHLKKKRNTWRPDDLIGEARRFLPQSMQYITEEIQRLLEAIHSLPKKKENFGLIHEDPNPTNFFVEDDKITLFDFDDCCYNYFISDISVALPYYSNIFDKSGWEVIFKRFLSDFFRGYFHENIIAGRSLELIPAYLRLDNISSTIFSYEIDEHNRKLYSTWFDKVRFFFEHGHPLYDFNFQDFYKNISS